MGGASTATTTAGVLFALLLVALLAEHSVGAVGLQRTAAGALTSHGNQARTEATVQDLFEQGSLLEKASSASAAAQGQSSQQQAGHKWFLGKIKNAIKGGFRKVFGTGVKKEAAKFAVPPVDFEARVEDCVACKFIWSQIEMDVGESKVDEVIHTSFVRNCVEAQEAPIFYPACQDMFTIIDDMIGDYIQDFTVDELCENNRICRVGILSPGMRRGVWNPDPFAAAKIVDPDFSKQQM